MTAMVPGRECGSCNICCIIPAIDRPDIQQISGATCRNCTASGCAIYEARPEVCQSYYCGWRRLEMIDAEWRPDLCGVLVELDVGNALGGFVCGGSVVLTSLKPTRTVLNPGPQSQHQPGYSRHPHPLPGANLNVEQVLAETDLNLFVVLIWLIHYSFHPQKCVTDEDP